ncbi:MAG: PPi-type phosphoenolpyruvate carboxykinase [Verrucomicrobiae bacterium]|nr:PPi-type phosphoenolpyruvate carboxykinase [Verrucomicrobiae bacterium]
MDWNDKIGLGHRDFADAATRRYINLKLALLGLPTTGELDELAGPLLSRQQEMNRLLADHLCPADQRIQDYLNSLKLPVKLPAQTFVLDRYGLARALSLPTDRDDYKSPYGASYRVQQGVLHNPKADRRTTAGIFHVAEGGLPIADDKRAVPLPVFGELLRRALMPPAAALRLPFAAAAETFVSLLLRPLVCPAVPGFTAEKSLEIRFFVPGSLVSNLDFVESIFGNAGDPFLPEHDAALDVEHWSGHTGCVILAPHLTTVTKQEIGLPAWDAATERQRRDGMCWKSPDELYNNGGAFKATCRDARGVILTVIADNYFGYCKKEVKTQISFAANLAGLCEEEHAGGALVYPRYDLGEEYVRSVVGRRHHWTEVREMFADSFTVQPEGYAVDKRFADILYVPEDAHFDLLKQTVTWNGGGVRLLPGKTYVRPSGYQVHMEKPAGGRSWRLIGTVPEPTVCHKPCTVSGGGKSEISKPITDAILQGPVFIADFNREFDFVARIIRRNYGDRFRDPAKVTTRSRPILSAERTLGSVIKLLTPAEEYTDAYNAWLESIPPYIKVLVFVVKRYYQPEMGDNWREHFSVDVINGTPGNELKFQGRRLVTTYLRVGFDEDGSWRTFGLRRDFHPAQKIQAEDDISASVVVPVERLKKLNEEYQQAAVKFVQNCEYRLFQRPDDAIHRGYDKQTEADFSKPGNFFSNFEPLTRAQANELIDDSIGFDKFTEPMQGMIRDFVAAATPQFVVSSSNPRLVDGKPSKNPRYLQTRPDLLRARETYLAEMGTRLWRRCPVGQPLHTPVNAVLPGRRNNPPEGSVRSLAVYNPIHYMELPELFMEYICSMTGKSPSTTGAGSEGALTKGPFNALLPIIDLNNALVSMLLTGDAGFVTAAGYVGPQCRVDHDISMIVPEVWSRMTVAERDPKFLIEHGYLERCRDFENAGRTVMASRLGWRITMKFVLAFFGRVFHYPHVVFTPKMLRPELQDLDVFVDGMDNVITTQRRVAQAYFDDGSITDACPPLCALLHIMRDDQFEGRNLNHPELRAMFTRENMLASDWYAARLTAQQAVDGRLWQRHVVALEQFSQKPGYAEEAARLGIEARLAMARQRLEFVRSAAYRQQLIGTLGVQPLK